MWYSSFANLTLEIAHSSKLTTLLVLLHGLSAVLVGFCPVAGPWRIGAILVIIANLVVALRRLSLQTGCVIRLRGRRAKLNGEAGWPWTATLLFALPGLIILHLSCKPRKSRVFVLCPDAVSGIRRVMVSLGTDSEDSL